MLFITILLEILMSKDVFGDPVWIRQLRKEKIGNWIKKHRIFLTSVILAISGIMASWMIADYYYNLSLEDIGKALNPNDTPTKDLSSKEFPLVVDITSLKNNEKLKPGRTIIINGTSEKIEEIFRLNLFNPSKDIVEDTKISITFEPENEFFGKMITAEKCSGDYCFSSEHPINVATINPNEVVTIQSTWNFSPLFLYESNQDFLLKFNISNQLYNKSIVDIYPINAVLSKPITRWGASIEVDQKVYTWTDKVYITIIDPGANLDSNQIDVIGYHKEDKKIRIFTESGNEIQYSAVESGYDTGIFTASLILSGFPNLDANNDGLENDATGLTFGRGPEGGFIATDKEDTLHVSYQFTPIENIEAIALINMNTAAAQFDKSSYFVNEMANVMVVDPDVNTNPEKIDHLIINVGSDTMPQGINIMLLETNEATGIFEGKVSLRKENVVEENELKVSVGDDIWMRYFDRTIPRPFQDLGIVIVEATSKIKDKS